MTAALAGAGLRAVGARSRAATEEALATEGIGCVVSDLGVTGMDRIDLVRSLRRRPENATLPVILVTGAEGAAGVLQALDAGADDILCKPVRPEEMVARVKAILRTRSGWTSFVVADLRTRAAAIHALGQLVVSNVPEEAARAVVAELAHRIRSAFVGMYRLVGEDQTEPLATWNARDGVLVGGLPLPPVRAQHLVRRAREGPWVERVAAPEPGEPREAFREVWAGIAAWVPIHAGGDLVGLLSIATATGGIKAPLSVLQARLLASAIDYANVLGVVAGPAVADHRQSEKEKTELRRVLASRRFFPVYQPIVDLRTREVVGYEALTRFIDGTPADIRFARAAIAGLGFEFELAAVEAAISAAPPVAPGGFLALNVSPDLVVAAGKNLKRALKRWNGRVILELTEQAPIANYDEFRWAAGRVGKVEISVDDARAGHESLRHILKLGPAWVKLDVSLVDHIDADPLRQALVAGLAHVGDRAGGPRLVAEGVEREEEALCLLGLGVEFAQGYLFGRPER
jgi:EAL domain-containing protein (putative c-di-GMP-specific phosphodiesterase class I)/DNA-binding NarL/FixJ family response regulator